jgi:hypothetical protein
MVARQQGNNFDRDFGDQSLVFDSFVFMLIRISFQGSADLMGITRN